MEGNSCENTGKMHSLYRQPIYEADNPFLESIKYAIIGNIIDFNPIHNLLLLDIEAYFAKLKEEQLELDDSNRLFQEIQKADIVIAKGQANYECLSDAEKNIFFLLMTKCKVIADDIGVPELKMICMKRVNKGKLVLL